MLDKDELIRVDQRGYTVLEAITPGMRTSATHSNPHTFVGIDGKTYWIKGRVQQGLVAELIAGRLTSRLGVGPAARILRVLPTVLAAASAPAELEGIVCGSEDAADTVNARELSQFIADGTFAPNLVDASSRARVIAFHSWLGMGDAQVLVRLTDGTVFSIDHGDCFGDVATLVDPTPIVVDIPGVDAAVGKDRSLIRSAVQRIERLTDREILDAVAGIPGGDPWRSPVERRHGIACWLGHRRDRLGGVMDAWAQT